MSLYYANTSKDTKTGYEYKVRPSTSKESKVNFVSLSNSLQIDFDLWLEGDFNIPNNLIVLQVASSIGNIQDISLEEKFANGVQHNFVAHCNLNFASTDLNKIPHFLEKLVFNTYFGVNVDSFNNAKLGKEFDEFIKNLNGMNLKHEICFSNYFPINKLSSFYLAKQYQHSSKKYETLPHDFFNWETDKMTSYPDFMFEPYLQLKNQPIVNLYKSNAGTGDISANFDMVKIDIDYLIDKKWKTTQIRLQNTSKNMDINNEWLSLNINTFYDFENQELIESQRGIKGIYFPIKTEGKIKISLLKGDEVYLDEIKFQFNKNIYSNSNENFHVEILDNTQQIKNIEWSRLSYV